MGTLARAREHLPMGLMQVTTMKLSNRNGVIHLLFDISVIGKAVDGFA